MYDVVVKVLPDGRKQFSIDVGDMSPEQATALMSALMKEPKDNPPMSGKEPSEL